MKRKALIFIYGVAALVLVVASVVNAEVYTIGANVPSSTGASFTVSKVAEDGIFVPHPTNNLDFGELTLDSTNDIFIAPHYFNIDIGGLNGAGIPRIQIQYSDTGAPNGATSQLGDHGTLSTFSVIGNPQGNSVVPINFLSLHQADGVTLVPGDLNGGFLRVALGVSTGNVGVEGDAVPFNLGSTPGVYTGTLTFTAVTN